MTSEAEQFPFKIYARFRQFFEEEGGRFVFAKLELIEQRSKM
jgi:hypothetical protein